MAIDLVTMNTGLPTENRYDPPSSDAHDTKIHDTKDGYKAVDPGTKPYIDKPDEAWKYRTSLGATDNIVDINDTYSLARYLFIGKNSGQNTIASTQMMQENYQRQGAANKFFTLA